MENGPKLSVLSGKAYYLGHFWIVYTNIFPHSLHSFDIFWPLSPNVFKQERIKMADIPILDAYVPLSVRTLAIGLV